VGLDLYSPIRLNGINRDNIKSVILMTIPHNFPKINNLPCVINNHAWQKCKFLIMCVPAYGMFNLSPGSVVLKSREDLAVPK
jgi:hypothetical protein